MNWTRNDHSQIHTHTLKTKHKHTQNKLIGKKSSTEISNVFIAMTPKFIKIKVLFQIN